jgi:hypothetical protein
MRRVGQVLLAIAISACAASEPPPLRAQPTAREKQALAAAYGTFQRAVICARPAASDPRVGEQQGRGEEALDRARAKGLGPLIDAIDAEYRRIDATIDWACSGEDRLAGLVSAVDQLSRTVDAAIDDR